MRRFFSETSFWNQPIGPNPQIDPESERLIAFMDEKDPRGFYLNLQKWTIPIYEVDRHTPRRKVFRRFESLPGHQHMVRSRPYIGPDHPLGHGPGFAEDAAAGRIPIPDDAIADPAGDKHMAIVDWESGWIWDMHQIVRRPDGEWESREGMKYRVDGSGVFDRAMFDVHIGESIHPYGPSRAAGVPALAGTIMHEEILEGRIEHKLGFCTMAAAFQRFVHPPACWTDGGWKNGLPEGATIQLDPDLDLAQFNLSRNATVIARALQEYGAVCVDVGGAHALYGQGLYADPKQRTWEGVLNNRDLEQFQLKYFRVMKMETVIPQGMGHRFTPEPGIGPDVELMKETETCS